MRAHTHAHTHTHTHTHTQFTNTHTRTHTHVHTLVGEVVYALFARSTLKLQLFLDFREIEKNCPEIEKLLVGGRWGCAYIGTFDSEIKCSQYLNQIQILTDCLVHHVDCAHLGTPWHRAVIAFCAVSYREIGRAHV